MITAARNANLINSLSETTSNREVVDFSHGLFHRGTPVEQQMNIHK